MDSVKTTTIIPISIYCFILGAYIVYLTAHMTFTHKEIYTSLGWLPVISSSIIGIGLVVLGIGFLQTNHLCWKVLFFGLAITISCATAFFIAFIIFLLLHLESLVPYFGNVQTASADWYALLGIFLSGIIVLYYLTREEVLVSFGGMDDLVSPF